jgi:hypothetical protein
VKHSPTSQTYSGGRIECGGDVGGERNALPVEAASRDFDLTLETAEHLGSTQLRAVVPSPDDYSARQGAVTQWGGSAS